MRDKEALEAKRFANTESSMYYVAIITSSESESERNQIRVTRVELPELLNMH